jgi:hypothetical protein
MRACLCIVLGLTGASGLVLPAASFRAVPATSDRARAGTVVNQVPDASTSGKWGLKDISPDGKFAQRVEGQTRKTWQFNDINQNRVQVAVTSEGRPMKADIQLWIGPDWTPFTLKAYTENGKTRPIQTIIGTRNKAAMIEVRGQRAPPRTAPHRFALQGIHEAAIYAYKYAHTRRRAHMYECRMHVLCKPHTRHAL